MQKISIVLDVQGKIFKTWVDKNIYFGSDLKLTLTLTLSLILGLGLGFNPNRSLRVRVRVSS